MRMRLLAVAHFKADKNKADVARTFNVSRRMVNEWVANYFNGDVSALESKKPSGRPSLLSSQQKAELIDYIEKQSQSASGGRLKVKCYKPIFSVPFRLVIIKTRFINYSNH
jgi:transposase